MQIATTERMAVMFGRLIRTLYSLLISLVSFDALAGFSGLASISYSPVASIPSLSPAITMALAFLVAAVIFRTMQSRGHGTLLSALAGLALLSGVAWKTNVKFIADAFAPPVGFLLTNPQGGTATDFVNVPSQGPLNGTTVPVTNQTSTPQTINTISQPNGWSVADPSPSSPQCTVGYTLSASAICYVRFYYPLGPG